jgi:hypothetical protein
MRNWVRLDVPIHARLERPVEAQAERDDRAEGATRGDRGLDRLEPALDPAHEAVVLDPLVMRLVRLAPELAAACSRRERGVPAAAVAMALGQVGVEGEVVPARAERLPVGELALRGEHRAEPRPGHEGEARVPDGRLQRGYDRSVAHHGRRIA